MAQEKKFNRHVATKITLATVSRGTYITEGEDAPNFLLTQDNKKIFRINVMGIIISIEKTGTITSMLIDDSTDVMTIRFFEENAKIDAISIGSCVLIIGKVRTYNSSMYITPEIIRKIDPLWLHVRAKECTKEISANKDQIKNNEPSPIIETVQPSLPQHNNPQVEDFTQNTEEKKSDLLPEEFIIDLIRNLDEGEGVSIEEIIEKSKIKNSEEVVVRLIANGEIFNNLPGKVKVL